MTLTLAPSPYYTGLDSAGVTLPGAKLFTYQSGTNTKLATYLDAAMSSANTNPIILDSAGRAVIYLLPQDYKFVLAPANDTDPPTSPIKTIDPVAAVPLTTISLDIQGTAGEALSAADVVYLSDGGGGRTAGLWYRVDASFAYSSIQPQVIGMMSAPLSGLGVSGPIRLAGRITGPGGLVAGTTYYIGTMPGTITSISPANSRIVGVADTATTLVLAEKRPDDVRQVAPFTVSGSNIGAGEDTLASYTDGVNGLYEDGMGWEGTFFGDTTNNANLKQLRLRIIEGANNRLVGDFPLTINEAGVWALRFQIIRVSATTFSSISSTICGPATGPASRTGNNILVGQTVTFANTIELRLTGEATANGDIRMVAGTIKRVGIGR